MNRASLWRPLWLGVLLIFVSVPAQAQVPGFFGTTTLLPFEISVNNERVVRLEPATPTEGPNVILGWSGNTVMAGVQGATIGGGGDPDASSFALPNKVTADYGTVSGGIGNKAGGYSATVGGGVDNKASGSSATVGGGFINTASGSRATVPGGRANQARGDNSFAAGYYARAAHDGAFVWSDNSMPLADSLVSTAEDQFLIRATGGVGVGTNAPQAQLHLLLNSTLSHPHLLLEEDNATDYARLRLKNTGSSDFWDVAAGAASIDQLNFYVSNGRGNVMSLRATGDPLIMYNGAKLTEGGTWTNASSRHLKTDFEAVDGAVVLARLAQVPIQTWRYKAEAVGRHMGPMAEDFYRAFGLGDTDEGIATVDADGVALAAIQGLYAQNQALQQQSREQQAELADLRAAVEMLRAQQEALAAELVASREAAAAEVDTTQGTEH